MPPQDETTMVASAASGTTITIKEDSNATAAPGSYWDEPEEEQLKGKRLSALSLTGLGHVEHGDLEEPEQVEAKNEAEAAFQAMKEADAALKETTSSASKDSYWDEPEETQLKGKRLSKLNLFGLGHVQHEDGTIKAERRESFTDYWNWQETPIVKTLSKLSLSDLVGGSRTSTATASTVDSSEEMKDGSAKSNSSSNSNTSSNNNMPRRPSGGYWFWKNPSTDTLTDGKRASLVDVQTMEKKFHESDKQEGQKGPISNLQHKLRSSWRASFQRLSTNSLVKLDENAQQQLEKDFMDASSRRTSSQRTSSNSNSVDSPSSIMQRNDSFVVHEEEEEGEAMTF